MNCWAEACPEVPISPPALTGLWHQDRALPSSCSKRGQVVWSRFFSPATFLCVCFMFKSCCRVWWQPEKSNSSGSEWGPTDLSTECVVVIAQHRPSLCTAKGWREGNRCLNTGLGALIQCATSVAGETAASVKGTKKGLADFLISACVFPSGVHYLSQRNVNYQMRPLIVPLRVKPSS